MSASVLVNLREAFLQAPGFPESSVKNTSGNWCKYIESLDKTQTDGYSIEGPFVNQIDQLCYQSSGLYLFCEKKGGKKNQQQRLYTLFRLEANGEVVVLTELRSASKDWAVQLWPYIEVYFDQAQGKTEQLRQELLSEIESLEFRLQQCRMKLAALDSQFLEESLPSNGDSS
ncbi:hypothetical protein [Geitlerinema sp. PCC 9228]|uniref:hypothetical protein n=1 Tax=Geitlerinema sp. PCC 9228 TaxID=111611 RepID=UPI0008F9C813|nr:hypothetical protein [Geitlerinema sp. PCC 9228]